MRQCGECTMCCKLLNIRKCNEGGLADFPFDKPAGTTCKHCKPGHGCELFGTAQFPNLCKSYFCLWKYNGKERLLPEECRPDKVHAIFEPMERLQEFPSHTIMSVVVDPSRGVGMRFLRFLEQGADAGVSFLVQDVVTGYGGVLSNNPELAKALTARERRDK